MILHMWKTRHAWRSHAVVRLYAVCNDIFLYFSSIYVPHCRILSSDKTEWRLITATLCGWRRCFVADQLWFMARIREEEEVVSAWYLFVSMITLEPFEIPPWNLYGSKIWLKVCTSSKMAAFWCTAVRGWWLNVADVLLVRTVMYCNWRNTVPVVLKTDRFTDLLLLLSS